MARKYPENTKTLKDLPQTLWGQGTPLIFSCERGSELEFHHLGKYRGITSMLPFSEGEGSPECSAVPQSLTPTLAWPSPNQSKE